MISIREATGSDVDAIAEIFRETYGDKYCHSEFFDTSFLRKHIYAEETLLLVADDSELGGVVGTASVMLQRGAYTDLVGEFGRLAVSKKARNLGIGRMLMQERLKRVENQLHLGLVDARVIHPYSAQIAANEGFSVLGFVPCKMQMQHRESFAVMARYFGCSLELRRNHARIIPEASEIVEIAMDNLGLKPDFIVDDVSGPYPQEMNFEIEELEAEGYSDLLRIERGRVQHRDIFGPMRLHYGFFKLGAKNSYYLIARKNGLLAGAIGFTIDRYDLAVRIFELINVNDYVIRRLFDALIKKCREEFDIVLFEVDVSAYAPRMQRTLLELGFMPVAFIPAMVFHQVERLDILKMVRLDVPLDTSHDVYSKEVEPVAELVAGLMRSREIHTKALALEGSGLLFGGLNAEQREQVAAYANVQRYQPREEIFAVGAPGAGMYLLLSGKVAIQDSKGQGIAKLSAGQLLGEVATLSEQAHSRRATAEGEVEVAFISKSDIERLIRLRPDIGVVFYKSVAIDLADKLKKVGS